MKTIDIAKRAAEIASDKLATDVVLLDTRQVCSFADYFVLCSSESERHMEAIREAINQTLREKKIHPLHQEGTSASGWMILDYDSVMVHIFDPTEREFYGFDELWSNAQLLLRMQ